MQSFRGSVYVAIFVDDCSRFKATKLLRKSDATQALKMFCTDFITPQGLRIGAFRTDNGRDFDGRFHRALDKLGITHERTPPTYLSTTAWRNGRWACCARTRSRYCTVLARKSHESSAPSICGPRRSASLPI